MLRTGAMFRPLVVAAMVCGLFVGAVVGAGAQDVAGYVTVFVADEGGTPVSACVNVTQSGFTAEFCDNVGPDADPAVGVIDIPFAAGSVGQEFAVAVTTTASCPDGVDTYDVVSVQPSTFVFTEAGQAVDVVLTCGDAGGGDGDTTLTIHKATCPVDVTSGAECHDNVLAGVGFTVNGTVGTTDANGAAAFAIAAGDVTIVEDPDVVADYLGVYAFCSVPAATEGEARVTIFDGEATNGTFVLTGVEAGDEVVCDVFNRTQAVGDGDDDDGDDGDDGDGATDGGTGTTGGTTTLPSTGTGATGERGAPGGLVALLLALVALGGMGLALRPRALR